MSVLEIKGFNVIDPNTNKYPDLKKIFREESWAEGLSYISPYGFALQEDGHLIAIDACGNQRGCPPDRFIIEGDVNGWGWDEEKQRNAAAMFTAERLITLCSNAIIEGQILERMSFEEALDELGMSREEFAEIMSDVIDWRDYDE